jgi:hypothetical protein
VTKPPVNVPVPHPGIPADAKELFNMALHRMAQHMRDNAGDVPDFEVSGLALVPPDKVVLTVYPMPAPRLPREPA